MHAESLAKMRGVELAAACDIKPERAKAKAGRYHCAAYTDYKKMLAREALDAVHILTPHYLHMPMALEAARRRINILLEKPMALNPAQAAREVATGRKAGVALSVISQNRFNTGSQLVKKRIKDGSLGKLKAARLILSYHRQLLPKERLERAQVKRGRRRRHRPGDTLPRYFKVARRKPHRLRRGALRQEDAFIHRCRGLRRRRHEV
jgi:predicted dehydrogenase